MEDKNNKVTFTADDNEKAEFYILEQTQLNGVTYLLVTDSDEEADETTAYILKDTSADEDDAAFYELVEDEEELALIAKIFEELLEDVDIET
jgi:hypothetical protein